MQAAYVLLERSFPRNRHREKQRVKPGVVETFTEIASCRQNRFSNPSFFVHWSEPLK
jgi:hypothetical protein